MTRPSVVPSNKPSRREAEKEMRREAILEAASHLFAERGLENVTFGDIAKETGLSRPLVYFYFPDRDTLFFEAVARSNMELQSRFVTAIKPHLSGLEQIRAIGRAYMGFLKDRFSCFHLLAAYSAKKRSSTDEHPIVAQIEDMHRRIFELLTSTLNRGVKDGSIRSDLGDLMQVAVCLWGFTHGIAQILGIDGEHLESSHGLDQPATVETAFDLLTQSLSATPK